MREAGTTAANNVENWYHAANNVGKRYRGVLKAAERFNWYEKEAKKRTRRHASAMEGVQGKRDGGGGGNSRESAV